MFSLKDKTNIGGLFENTLNFYTQFAFGTQNKSILADFNGYINDSTSEELQTKLQIIG